jgi:hypothetical protein
VRRAIGSAALSLGVTWITVSPGVALNETTMSKAGPLAVVRAITLRIDPDANFFELRRASTDQGLRAAWTIDSIPANAVLALNTSQFTAGFPWGWVVRNGIEEQPPGNGPLSMAFVVDQRGRATLATHPEILARQENPVLAFQSFPALLVDGEMPWELRAPGRGVDLSHRDSRLAICTTRKGMVIVVLTRFGAFGDAGGTLPWGPTVPEMATHMRGMGCDRAMLLDGGVSSQMAVRRPSGTLTKWTNWRMVPMGIVVSPKARPRSVRRSAAPSLPSGEGTW